MATDTDLGVAVRVATDMRNDAERFAKTAKGSSDLADKSADRAEAARAEVEVRQETIEDIIASNVPTHEWEGSRLRLINPNGTFGGYVDLLGPQGVPGEPGVQGDPGAPGIGGVAGLSAYQLAVNDGFVGNVTQWVASLRGADGAPGTGLALKGVLEDSGDLIEIVDPQLGDAYLIAAVLWVYGGPLEQWINAGAILGPTGPDGRDAYEVAVEAGYVGTRAAWLASLRGPQGYPGQNGASAYADAVANGYVGDLASWLASLKAPASTAADLDLEPFVGKTPASLPLSDAATAALGVVTGAVGTLADAVPSIADDRIVTKVGRLPAIARPGVDVVHKLTMQIRRSGNAEGTVGEIFPGSSKAPQGGFAYKDRSDGLKKKVIFKQRVNSAVPPPNTGTNQYHHLVQVLYSDVGPVPQDPEFWTAQTLALSHQGLSGAYFPGGILGAPEDQLWVCSASPETVVYGDDEDEDPDVSSGGTQGITFIKWRGAATTNADCTHIRLMKATDPYSGSVIISTSGKLIAMACNHTGALGNDQSTDERNLIFIWRTADVLAAGAVSGDASGVPWISCFKTERGPETDSSAFQDYHLDDTNSSGFFEIYSGSTGPQMRHYVIIHDAMTGQHIRTKAVDDARIQYTRAQLEGSGIIGNLGVDIGLPSSMEAEIYTGFPGEDARICGVQEIWTSPRDIVSLPETPNINWACAGSGTRTKPGDNRGWFRTSRAPTRGVWDPAVTDYLGVSGTRRRRLNLVEIRPATGDPAERPLDGGLTTFKPNSSLHFPDNNRDVSINPDRALRFSTWHSIGGYYTDRAFLFQGDFALYDDHPAGVANAQYASFRYNNRSVAGAKRSFITLAASNMATDPYWYCDDDAVYPQQFRYGRESTGWSRVVTRNGAPSIGEWHSLNTAIIAGMNGRSLYIGASTGEAEPTALWAFANTVQVSANVSFGDLYPGVDAGYSVGIDTRYLLNVKAVNVYARTQFLAGANKVVGARETGWAADTGTAKKTSTASYTTADVAAFTAVAAPGFAAVAAQTAEAAYTQSTIQTLMTTVAAQSTQIAALTVLANANRTQVGLLTTLANTINAQVKNVSQAMKALKDALIAHGLIGT